MPDVTPAVIYNVVFVIMSILYFIVKMNITPTTSFEDVAHSVTEFFKVNGSLIFTIFGLAILFGLLILGT